MANRSRRNRNSFDGDRARKWYDMWRDRIHRWIREKAGSEWADFLALFPDLLMLCVGLATDKRIPKDLRSALAVAVAYVLSPFDLMPEAVVGVAGLVDDLGMLAMVLSIVFGALDLETDVLREVLRDRWHGREDPVKTVARIVKKFKRKYGRLLRSLRRILRRNRFGRRRGNSGRNPFDPIPIT